jgi:hypothetical protein
MRDDHCDVHRDVDRDLGGLLDFWMRDVDRDVHRDVHRDVDRRFLVFFRFLDAQGRPVKNSSRHHGGRQASKNLKIPPNPGSDVVF